MKTLQKMIDKIWNHHSGDLKTKMCYLTNKDLLASNQGNGFGFTSRLSTPDEVYKFEQYGLRNALFHSNDFKQIYQYLLTFNPQSQELQAKRDYFINQIEAQPWYRQNRQALLEEQVQAQSSFQRRYGS